MSPFTSAPTLSISSDSRIMLRISGTSWAKLKPLVLNLARCMIKMSPPVESKMTERQSLSKSMWDSGVSSDNDSTGNVSKQNEQEGGRGTFTPIGDGVWVNTPLAIHDRILSFRPHTSKHEWRSRTWDNSVL